MEASAQDQTALDERVIEDADLEKVLDDRQIAKGAAGEAKKKVDGLKAMADEMIEKLDLGVDEKVRVGRFVIKKSHVDEAERAFTVPARDQLSISLAPLD